MKKISLIGLICVSLLCSCGQKIGSIESDSDSELAVDQCMDFSGYWLGSVTSFFEQGDDRIEFPMDYALKIDQEGCTATASMTLNPDLEPEDCTITDKQIHCEFAANEECLNQLNLDLKNDQLVGTLSSCGTEDQPVSLDRSTEKAIADKIQETYELLNTPVEIDEDKCAVACNFKPEWEEFFCDEFKNNKNEWTLGSTENDLSVFSVQIDEGKLVLESTGKATSGYQSGVLQCLPSFNDPYTNNFVVQLTGKISSDYKGSAWGVAFDGSVVTGNTSFYFFEISNAGTYLIEKMVDNKISTIVSVRENKAIKIGEENTIAVVGESGVYDFYVNGELLTSQELEPLDATNLLVVTSVNEGVKARIEIDDVYVRSGPWE